MAKKAKAKVKPVNYVFIGLMCVAAVLGLVGLLIATHTLTPAIGETQNFTLAQLAEAFATKNKVPGADFSTTALTLTNVFGWVAVVGALLLVVIEVLNLFGIKMPSIAKWILVALTLVCAVGFIVSAATVCVDFHGKKLYDSLVKDGYALKLAAGSYLAVIGAALVPVFAVAKKMLVK